MGRRDRERVDRVIAGTEPPIHHSKSAPAMVRCTICNHILPEAAAQAHMEKEHPYKYKKEQEVPLLIAAPSLEVKAPTMEELKRYVNSRNK